MSEQVGAQPAAPVSPVSSPRAPDSAAHPTPALAYLVLGGGVLAAASSSILIRFAQGYGLPATTIAAGRLGIAALILLPIMLLRARAEVAAIARRDLAFGMLSGLVLAVHFISWISSLQYTSVASSASLVATNPLWVALASLLLFRERLARAAILGILLTVGGSVLIGVSDGGGSSAAPNPLLGDGLALLGALAGSAYFLIGRDLRRRMTTLPYIWLVYTSAAVVLVAVASFVGWGSPPPPADGQTLIFGWPPVAALAILGLALGPQLLGHTSFNWALRFLSATFVAVTILGEPIGSALLALLIFREWFAPLQLVGFVLLLVGIVVALRAERAA